MTRASTAALITAFVLTALSCGTDDRPNVLLILVDTVRADHFSCYGYHRETTPYTDSLAGAGTLFLKCQGQSSWTLPTMTAILSGVSPVQHGAGRYAGEFHGVAGDLPWLPLAFHRQGYRTAAFFNVMFMNEDFGFHRGFQHFDCQGVASGNSLRRAGQTVDDFLLWLDSSQNGSPFFAAVHFYDPHIPYNAPEPYFSMFSDPEYQGDYDQNWGDVTEMVAINTGEVVPSAADIQNLVDLYNGEIAYTDSEIGRMLQELRLRGLGDNTLIVLVGDHGEEFLEHGGIEHGRTLYQELTHVPLVISGPGFADGGVISENVAQLDLPATIAAATGIEFEVLYPALDLGSLSGEIRQVPASGVLWRSEGDIVSVVMGNQKIIWSVEDDSVETYDLVQDPLELAAMDTEQVLLEAAEFYWVTPPLCIAPLVDYGETAARELRNLGYIR